MSGREADLPKYPLTSTPFELAFRKRRAHLRQSAEHAMPFRASCVGLVASLPISARKNAGISLAMRLCSNVTGIHSRSTSR
jgi:hypothetical protein